MSGFLSVTKSLQDKKDKEYLENKADTNATNITTNATDIATNATNLTTHKSSSDHDGRYYTKTEVDALIATNYLYLTLSANQTSGLSAGSDVQFDTSSGTITYNATTHEMTLKSGKTYVLFGSCGYSASTSAYINFQWYDVTNSTYIGQKTLQPTSTYASDYSTTAEVFAVVTPASDVQVELRIQGAGGTITAIRAVKSKAFIRELK